MKYMAHDVHSNKARGHSNWLVLCGIVDLVFILGARDKKCDSEKENGVSNEHDFPLLVPIHDVAEAKRQTQGCHLAADQVD